MNPLMMKVVEKAALKAAEEGGKKLIEFLTKLAMVLTPVALKFIMENSEELAECLRILFGKSSENKPSEENC